MPCRRLAPIFSKSIFISEADLANSFIADLSNCNVKPSAANNCTYYSNKLYLGSHRTLSNSMVVRAFNSTLTGSRPNNSGIRSVTFA
mgnify:CR=1 FL=1